MSRQPHSLRVVHRLNEPLHKPQAHSQLQLQVVFEDLQAIVDLIEKEVSPEEGELQQGQAEQ